MRDVEEAAGQYYFLLGGHLDAATNGRDEVGDIVAHKEAVGELGELGDRAGSRHDCRETERRRDQATGAAILRGAAKGWRIACCREAWTYIA